MAKDKKSKDKKRTSSDSARRIWLAGIGAYGRAFSEAQGALKDMTGKGSAVFDELVEKGEMLETVGKIKGKEMLEKAKVADLDLDFDVDERIKAMRARLTRSVDTPPAGDDFEDRLSALEAKLDKILTLLEAGKAPPKKARRKPATTKRTVKAKSKPSAAKD